ncbi:MAG TPA: hypothetical protein VOA78_12265 [Candidatus Dormibacteraeota bacterium]|nr:hypothetical protein [Candidatus Dormibacteraeota bacterium]
MEPWLDRCLKVVEFATVAGLAGVVFTMAIYETYWVLWGGFSQDRQVRAQAALTMLNGNWKIGLLLLIPCSIEQCEPSYNGRRNSRELRLPDSL